MKWILVVIAVGLFGIGTLASANSKIMAEAKRAERAKPENERIKYSCATCHSGPAPSKVHPYDRKQLTEEGKLWLPAAPNCVIQ